MKRTVIIGGGPAGLSTGLALAQSRQRVLLIERDGTTGGLSRTMDYKGYRFDVGGHRFHSTSEEVLQIWKDLLGDDFKKQQRLSRIYFKGRFFKYPLQLSEAFHKLGYGFAFLCFLSFLRARMIKRTPTNSFEDWIVNRFGERLYKTFFKTYTEKVWGISCTEISSDWASQRIQKLSIPSLLKSFIFPSNFMQKNSNEVKTLIDSFYYPRFGAGQMWEAAADRITSLGGEVKLSSQVCTLHRDKRGIRRISLRVNGSQATESIRVDQLVSSMPLGEFIRQLDPPAPEEVLEAARQLTYRDLLLVVLIVEGADIFPDHWIYIHDPSVKVGRIQNFNNWSLDLIPDKTKSCLALEYFCWYHDSLYKSSDHDIIENAKSELRQLGLINGHSVIDGSVVRVPQAYPIYEQSYRHHLDIIRRFAETSLSNTQLIGRNGMHRYNNQDHSMMTGILAARNIIEERIKYNLWSVTQNADYQEEGKALE